ncbi:hypothetical protein [Phytoactinopolyspora endophytica]|uniref:hypothetical protein n=1 Tax=Phytoactinopolyspora endophytica TaxID=1642495 RepID=UPI00101CE3BE|nr:hypothetical protein [Phytoactinopolyspora endophytica]
MAPSPEENDDGVLAKAGRAIGQGLWMLIPVLSFGTLAFVPAAQAYWRARTTGWLLTAAVLALMSVAVVVMFIVDADGSVAGIPWILDMIGGVSAAAAGRKIVFDRPKPQIDPAVKQVLHDRMRRQQARGIVERDPAMALELGIGRPDTRREYADGGLMDLNNVTAAGIVHFLGWRPDVADTFVAERDARHGYTSLTEIGALSGVDPKLLETHSDRIVLLPFQGGKGTVR